MALANRTEALPIEEILSDLQPRIRAIFSRFRIPEQDAEDVLQQTLLTYLYKRNSIHDPERWLLGALRNRCLVYWRNRRRTLYTAVDKVILESMAASDGCPQDQADFLRDLNLIISELPARCQNLLWLRYRQGYAPPEAARRLGYKASSIYKITDRCLAALARRLVACGLVEGRIDA
jgi:RNA polymerase sigma factor (sigma-70 family)